MDGLPIFVRGYCCVAFLGDKASIYARFALGLLGHRRKTLVYDAGVAQKLYLGVLGNTEDEPVFFRGLYLTRDIEYVMSHCHEYETVVINDDFIKQTNYVRYQHIVTYSYLCFGMDRYSCSQLCKFHDYYGDKEAGRYSYIFYGTEEDAVEWGTLLRWEYYATKRQKPEMIFYYADLKPDWEQYMKLEYGAFALYRLSEPMQAILRHVAVICNRDISYLEDVPMYGV